jgi:hypothetical protein
LICINTEETAESESDEVPAKVISVEINIQSEFVIDKLGLVISQV